MAMCLNHHEFLVPGRNWESGAQIARREREERIQRIRKQREEAPVPDDEGQNRPVKRQKPSFCANYNNNNNNSRLLLPPPPGWLDCPAIGREILGFLIPSKVPLCDSYQTLLPPAKKYSFTQVLGVLGKTKQQLGLVIDLTNSTLYYNPNIEFIFKKDNIRHVKIPCKGRDSVPDNESVNKFFYEVHQFQLTHKTKKHVLVHCTHGHNRTGYMIVHYLMRTQQPHMSVTRAIKLFADARPPGIYKPDYIDALYDFYHEKKPGPVIVSTPDWKKRSCSDQNEDRRPSAPPPQEPPVVNISVMSNDDVLGDRIPGDQETEMQQFCLLMIPPKSSSRPRSFPGSHPVSLNRENMQLLRQCHYYATWKADGTRYMMLITMDGCYLVDRNFRFRRVQMRFPCINAANRHHHYTLLDGEMVIDSVPGSAKQERRYLIYDMMAINGVSIVKRPFCERWEMIEREVIEPRNSQRNPDYRYDLEPFGVRRKGFWTLSTVEKILKRFIPKLPHEADGLVFQGWDDDYVPRTHDRLLKWKYPEMNSVDFLFEIVDDDRQLLFLMERGKKKPMDGRVVFPDGSDGSDYAGKIVECSWDSEENAWVCMRVRVDKGTPNDFRTYEKVMRSIKDNITEEVLLNEIDEIICLPMYVDEISKAHPSEMLK